MADSGGEISDQGHGPEAGFPAGDLASGPRRSTDTHACSQGHPGTQAAARLRSQDSAVCVAGLLMPGGGALTVQADYSQQRYQCSKP